MLKQRIISTIKFFDLQDYPLTFLELQKFLLADLENLKPSLDSYGEIASEVALSDADKITSADEILDCLDNQCRGIIENHLGFYHLPGRKNIVDLRLQNYFFGIKREKLIKRYVWFLKYIPFVRGVALAGSQAMGQEKETSDIDLLIITDPKFMWLARTLVTGYFQILGKRRHGLKIANRFCLNHYLAGPKEISQLQNFYTASEYLKLRPLVYEHSVWAFQKLNLPWLKVFFPNAVLAEPEAQKPSKAQEFLEKIFLGKFGAWLENNLKNWQLPRIRQEKFIVVEDNELSFHPESKQEGLLMQFLRG